MIVIFIPCSITGDQCTLFSLLYLVTMAYSGGYVNIESGRHCSMQQVTYGCVGGGRGGGMEASVTVSSVCYLGGLGPGELRDGLCVYLICFLFDRIL